MLFLHIDEISRFTIPLNFERKPLSLKSAESKINSSHTMTTSSSQGQSIGFVGKVDWADFMKNRPEYPQEFYERIYKQVKLSGGSYDAVNDMTPLIVHEEQIVNHENVRLRSRR